MSWRERFQTWYWSENNTGSEDAIMAFIEAELAVKDAEIERLNLAHQKLADVSYSREETDKVQKFLKNRISELEGALRFYADESEWYKHYTVSAWKLLFNSSNHDGHGYEVAQKALTNHKEGSG